MMEMLGLNHHFIREQISLDEHNSIEVDIFCSQEWEK